MESASLRRVGRAQSRTKCLNTEFIRRTPPELEVVVIPVSDVDRAKRFYSNLGWRLDADFAMGDEFRIVVLIRRAILACEAWASGPR